jgi:propionyl-CoA carboxylase alpha chain
MRIAWTDAEAREGFQSSKNEAAASFGDDRIFIEKFVTQPRHIEIQVLADSTATASTCTSASVRSSGATRRSSRRRPRPSSIPRPAARWASRPGAGEGGGLCSAGTVEFIVDGARNFYFLEMNTRLQVEHPVTELITGIDLVEQMIRVAAGERLGFGKADPETERLGDREPALRRGSLPQLPALDRTADPLPPAGRGTGPDRHAVRNDTGVFEGGEISMYYDPMIAKLCTWAPDRRRRDRSHAPGARQLRGRGDRPQPAIPAAVMDHPKFVSGDITTAFIAEEFPEGFQG